MSQIEQGQTSERAFCMTIWCLFSLFASSSFPNLISNGFGKTFIFLSQNKETKKSRPNSKKKIYNHYKLSSLPPPLVQSPPLPSPLHPSLPPLVKSPPPPSSPSLVHSAPPPSHPSPVQSSSPLSPLPMIQSPSRLHLQHQYSPHPHPSNHYHIFLHLKISLSYMLMPSALHCLILFSKDTNHHVIINLL